MRRILALVLLTGFHVMAAAQVCAPPALLLTTIPPGGIINDFYAGSGTPNLNAGVSSFTLGTRDTRGYTTTLVIGDLLMVMQMQDGSINSSNNSNYGDGTGVGSGSTSVGNAGKYEFVRITAVAGLNVTVTPPLTNSYVDSAPTATAAQRRYQVVRALQFSSVTAVNVITPPWNGATGGVVAMDVRDTLTLGSSTIEGQTNRAIYAAGKGFRGGRAIASGADGTAISGDYATSSALGYHASKGEGFIGTPLNLAVKTGNWSFKTTNPVTTASLTLGTATAAGGFEGYPSGSYARGAPGNAGGGGVDSDNDGGNSNNSGGGGGGNYGPGGIGGRAWNSPLLDIGGRGGAGYAGTLAFDRVFMGGGGGAGGTNNATVDPITYTNNGISCGVNGGICSSGAAGGGVVVIRARQVTGTGVIDVRGANGYNVDNDAGGGGGAGGSVIIETPNGGSATVDASGGDGGNAENNQGAGSWPGERHGPGGAGGGGFVAYAPNTMAVSVTVNGGAPGETTIDGTNAAKPIPEYYGSSGFNGGITTFLSPNVPGAPQAALCDPNLSLTKSNGVTALASPGSTTYTFTITNSGNSASNGTITLADRLPPGLTVTPGALATGGPNGASFSCTAANTTDIICISTVIVQPSGGTRVFTIGTTVNGTNGLSIVNRAVVSGGGDPNKATTATVVIADTCTANNTPAGCAIDTDTILAPNLSLTKTDGTTTVARGGTVVYSLTVTNGGGSTTVGTIVVADLLPTGLTFSGTSPFTVNNFTCTVSGQGITCNRATALAASTSALITFTAVVSNSAPSSVANRAKVGGGGDPSPSKSTAPTTATAALCPAPTAPADTYSDPDTGCASDVDAVLYVDLELTKDDGQAFVNSGGTTDYVFVVRNIGTAPTTGQINFGDVVPGNTMSFVVTGTFTPTGTDGADWSCTRAATSTTFCVSSVSIPAGGSSSFILRANIGVATVGSQQINRARVGGGGDVSVGSINSPTAANITACVGNGNPVGCATDLNTVQAAAEIRLSKTHTGTAIKSVGDTFTFTLVIRNNAGTASAGAGTVRLMDIVPNNLTINTVTFTASISCSRALQIVSCSNTAALTATTSYTVSVNVTVASTATNAMINRAQVGTNGADPQNNTTPTLATVTACSGTDTPAFGCAVDAVVLNADLQIYKDQRLGQSGAFQTTLLGVALGDVVQYRLQIVNAAGSALVSTATFSDPVPFHVSVNGASTVTLAGGAAGCSVAFTGSQLNGTVTSLPAGSTCTVVIQGTATTSSVGATNSALVTVPSGINDTVPGNNTATVLTAIGVANLSVTKTDGTTTVGAGANTTYTIVATNAGPSPANGARIYDPAVTGLSCTAAPACVAAGAATCPGGLTMGQLQNTTPPLGVAIPTFGSGGSITITVVCGVTATGQ